MVSAMFVLRLLWPGSAGELGWQDQGTCQDTTETPESRNLQSSLCFALFKVKSLKSAVPGPATVRGGSCQALVSPAAPCLRL